MKSKKLIKIIMYVVIGLFILLPNSSKAVLQANGGTPATKNLNDWLIQIRQMQQAGGALGLTDTINTTNLTSENKNLDIHMEKNTEYGAMAILSASSYGKQDKVNNGETTTGNSTGIKININKEWTAAGNSNLVAETFRNALGRYKNIYTTETTVGKAGDALFETKGWHGGSTAGWLGSNNVAGVRAHSGSIFSYSNFNRKWAACCWVYSSKLYSCSSSMRKWNIKIAKEERREKSK